MFSEDDLLPISALQHLLFCPRQCALIHVERLWADNRLTIEGRHLHEKTDRGRTRRRGELRVTRSMPLRSLTLGLFGKADVVEFRPTGVPASDFGALNRATGMSGSTSTIPFPVEYKRGQPKKDGSDRVQLCAQALCLEEMLGVPVPAGAIFYGRTRRRQEVVFDEALRSQTRKTIGWLHDLIAAGVTPIARREKKCDRCSLLHLCLPEALEGSESASRYLDRSLTSVRSSAGPVSGADVIDI